MHHEADKNSMNLCQLIPTHYEKQYLNIISDYYFLYIYNYIILSVLISIKLFRMF